MTKLKLAITEDDCQLQYCKSQIAEIWKNGNMIWQNNNITIADFYGYKVVGSNGEKILLTNDK